VAYGRPSEIRLVNNIAVQFRYLPVALAAEAVASHLQRFWDPRMKSRLIELAAGETDGLEPVARAAVTLLRQHSGGGPTPR
jgi:formate dehydrogenase subunit delta